VIVKSNLLILSLKFILSMAWWDHVTVNPEEIKIMVFIKGISKGLNGWIPKGGHS
jgi:hypothetical protein